MSHYVFNFFSDTKEAAITKLSAYLSKPRSDIEKALAYGCSSGSFIDELQIDLNAFNSSKVSIVGRHITTSSPNELCSITDNGLMNLSQSLQESTPLSRFLRKNKVHIDVSNKLFTYRGTTIPIEERKTSDHVCFMGRNSVCMWSFGCEAFQKLSILGNKLYTLGATLEFFISGSIAEMLEYSTVSHCPEILNTIDQLMSAIRNPFVSCTFPLCQKWILEYPNCYIIEFEVELPFMETYNPISYVDAYHDIRGCFKWSNITRDDYFERRIPQRVFDNRFLIENVINAYVYPFGEHYGSLLPGLSISPDKLKVYQVENEELTEI